MPHLPRPLRSLLPALLMAGTALLAAGCRQQAPAAPEPSASAAPAAPDTKPGLALSGGRLILPAVKGNPAAAYFTLTNGGTKPVTLAAVNVDGAGMAMFHETAQVGGHSTMGDLTDPAVPPGAALTFAPGGKHVMIDGLPDGLKPGAQVEMTLTFADGDKLSAPLTVETPGGLK